MVLPLVYNGGDRLTGPILKKFGGLPIRWGGTITDGGGGRAGYHQPGDHSSGPAAGRCSGPGGRRCRGGRLGNLTLHSAPAALLVEAELPGSAGLLDRIVAVDPGAYDLLLTERSTAESALEGVQHGACDCLGKPFSAAALQQRMAEWLGEMNRRRETLDLDERLLDNFRFHGMAGRSPQNALEHFARASGARGAALSDRDDQRGHRHR